MSANNEEQAETLLRKDHLAAPPSSLRHIVDPDGAASATQVLLQLIASTCHKFLNTFVLVSWQLDHSYPSASQLSVIAICNWGDFVAGVREEEGHEPEDGAGDKRQWRGS